MTDRSTYASFKPRSSDEERCYSCGLPFDPKEKVALLRDEQGLYYAAHERCLNEDFVPWTDEDEDGSNKR
jgi:hypothetical protein